MQRPQHAIAIAREPLLSPRRMSAVALVGLIQFAFIWSIVSGLAVKIVQQIPAALEVTIIDTPQTAEPTLAPPKPNLVAPPSEPTVAPPVIQIDTPQPSSISVAQMPNNASPDGAAAGIASTHTTPPYPPVSRRLGEQGTVRLHLTIDAQGNVTAAQVTNSSGVAELDQTAVDWVVAHWKYRPAMQNGLAVASTADAEVVFSLKNAQ